VGAYGLVLNQDTFTIFISEGFDPSMMDMPAELVPGVYFLEPSEAIPFYVSKITFPKPLSTIKKLDMKYIPLEDFPQEAPPTWDKIVDKPFYEKGFEYNWDGQITDQYTVRDESNGLTYVYMGDARVSRRDLKLGVVAEVIRDGEVAIIDASGPVWKFVSESDDKYYPDVTLFSDWAREDNSYSGRILAAYVAKDNANSTNGVFKKRGIYFAICDSNPNNYCTRLFLPNSIQKWESEYLSMPALGRLENIDLSYNSNTSIIIHSYNSGSYNHQEMYKVSDEIVEDVSWIESAEWYKFHQSFQKYDGYNIWSMRETYVIKGDGWFALMCLNNDSYSIPMILCTTKDNVTLNGYMFPNFEYPDAMGVKFS
jgi:hypothetical protein